MSARRNAQHATRWYLDCTMSHSKMPYAGKMIPIVRGRGIYDWDVDEAAMPRALRRAIRKAAREAYAKKMGINPSPKMLRKPVAFNESDMRGNVKVVLA